jgi:hypothetical protein
VWVHKIVAGWGFKFIDFMNLSFQTKGKQIHYLFKFMKQLKQYFIFILYEINNMIYPIQQLLTCPNWWHSTWFIVNYLSAFYFILFCEISPKCKKNWGCDIYRNLFIYFVEIRQKKQGFWIGFRRPTLMSFQMVARFFLTLLSYVSHCYLMLILSWDASQWYNIKKNWKKNPLRLPVSKEPKGQCQ